MCIIWIFFLHWCTKLNIHVNGIQNYVINFFLRYNNTKLNKLNQLEISNIYIYIYVCMYVCMYEWLYYKKRALWFITSKVELKLFWEKNIEVELKLERMKVGETYMEAY